VELKRTLIVADASSLINFEASQAMDEILETCGLEVGVVHPQVWTEVLYVRRPGIPDTAVVAIDLEAHERAGIVRRLRLDPAEMGVFVHLAGLMDDGEAASLAVAITRRLDILGDDRALARLMKSEAPTVRLLSTPMLVRQWVDVCKPEVARASEIIENIEKYGRFVPAVTEPNYQWWAGLRRPTSREG